MDGAVTGHTPGH